MTGFKLVQDDQKVVYYQKRKTSGNTTDETVDQDENKTPAPKDNKKTVQKEKIHSSA